MVASPRSVRRSVTTAVASLFLLLLPLAAPCRAGEGNDGVFDVLAHGAKGDGTTDDSAAIVRTYEACAAHGGGRVVFRTGHVFRTGPFELACNHSVTEVQAGAVVAARNTTNGWPLGMDCPEPAQGRSAKQAAPFLQVYYGINVTLTGGGTVDANGEMFWREACGNWWCPKGYNSTSPLAFRPYLYRIDHSRDVAVHNVTVLNPGFWCIVPVHSRGITVTSVRIHAEYSQRPPHWPSDRHDLLDTPNTDGIEPMWSSNVYVSDVHITNGDDCITVKSGSSDVLVENLHCQHGDGLTIGSVWYDNVTNVTYRNVLMNYTHNGPMIKGRSQGNATIRDVLFENIVLNNVYLAVSIDNDYETAGSVSTNIGCKATGIIFRNVTGTVAATRPRATLGAGVGKGPPLPVDAAGDFRCLAHRVCDFTLDNVHITRALANETLPPWTCNNSVVALQDVSPRVPASGSAGWHCH